MDSRPVPNPRTASRVQLAATIVGAAFLVVGILGFIPGITTHYGAMEGAGHESHAQLIGIFEVSVLHNVVHLLFGIVGLLAARSWNGARTFLVVGGIVYFLLFVYGLFFHDGEDANFVPLDWADNWLHLALSVGMVALGLLLGRRMGTRNDQRFTTG